MSSAVVSTSAALGRPFLFDADDDLEVSSHENDPKKPAGSHGNRRLSIAECRLGNAGNSVALGRILPASRLEVRPAPEMVTSGIAALDALTGGLPRGCVTEICGSASSGRTTMLLAALAAATGRGEYCAVVDASDALDAQSVAAAGVDLDRLLWVRCEESSPRSHRATEKGWREKSSKRNHDASEHRLEQVLRATDLLLESGGFGMIVLDLADLPPQAARRIPLTTWFRFRRAIEHKPTILLVLEQQPIAGSCSSVVLKAVASSQLPVLSASRNPTVQNMPPAHAELLSKLEIKVELVRSRWERKPARSIAFETRTAWVG